MNAGIYIHIPFCRSRCSYCDFATGMYESAAAETYVRALQEDLGRWTTVKTAASVDTVYFGGGTPSLLAAEQLARVLAAINDRLDVMPGAEITIEMNPGDGRSKADNQPIAPLAGADEKKRHDTLTAWRSLGINRVSFGAQTFDDEQLRQLGRTHSAADIRHTFSDLRAAGFDNINFDLIAGLPGQTLAAWERNLAAAIALRPEHLSLYLLDVHEGTPLADQIQRGMRPPVDEDLAAEMYRIMIERVCAAGYAHYEISNFCLAGYEARHNTKYWTGEPYYGFGCSAHSYDGRFRRWSNERDVNRYTELIESGASPVVQTVELSEDDARAESMFLGLRMMRGLNMNSVMSRFGIDPRDQYREDLQRFSEAGLIEFDGDLMRLTRSGALLSNEVFAAFV